MTHGLLEKPLLFFVSCVFHQRRQLSAGGVLEFTSYVDSKGPYFHNKIDMGIMDHQFKKMITGNLFFISMYFNNISAMQLHFDPVETECCVLKMNHEQMTLMGFETDTHRQI